MALTTLVMASANPKKVAELQAIVAALLPEISIVARPADVPDVVEDADTLDGNALLKAAALAAATGLPAVADDTGLFVDALDGHPGVRSARYAGEPTDDQRNIDKLLASLTAVSATDAHQRSAAFHTTALVAFPNGLTVVGRGSCSGSIALERRGAEGFGYDAVFIPTGFDRTFAQMTAEEKHSISHRRRALDALAAALIHQ